MTKHNDQLEAAKNTELAELAYAKQRFFDSIDKALETLLADLNRKEGKKEHGHRVG